MTGTTLFALGAAGLLGGARLFNRHLRRELAPERNTDGGSPADWALPAQTLSLPTRNGLSLFAWHIPSLRGDAAPANVLLHGWGGNAANLLPLAAPLAGAGYRLLLVDARNHGRSDTDHFSSMTRFAEDLEAAIDWLQEGRHPPPQIALIGHSVGAAAVLLAASRRRDLSAVVSLAAFSHPETVMRRFLAARRMPFMPLGWYALRYVEHVIGHRFDDIAPENTVGKLACPLLLMHGTEDETVPSSDAERLAARAGPTARLRLLRGDHESIEAMDEAIAELLAFLGEACPPDRAAHTG